MAERSIWEFKIKNTSGEAIAILSKASVRKVSIGLNKAGEASFEYDLQDLKDLATSISTTVKALLSVGINTLECYRNGELFFAGQIITANKKFDATRAIITVKALGWFWLLGTRFAGTSSDKVFTDEDAGAIAVELISDTQSLTDGSFGITQGTIDTSLNRTITYTRKNVKEAIEDLSSAESGFDFEVTPARIFNVHYPLKGTDKSSTVRFEYPGKVVREIQEQLDGSRLVNNILALGQGIGGQELSVERDDTVSQGVFKRRERISSFKDIENATVLGDIADQVLLEEANVVPLYKLKTWGNSSSPSLEDYTTGDFINLKVSTDFFTLDRAFRVFKIDVTIDNNDLEKVDLVVGII